jgi:lysozyme
MTLMTISQKGIDLIKTFEGCKLFAYRDSVGVPTIGYGHVKGVKMGMSITQKQAEEFLKSDIKPVERLLNGMGINYTQNQFDALTSWIFNLGEGNFKKSTMYKNIVARKSDIEITDQMVKWVNAGGKPLAGLKRRRVAEANMFLGREMYYVDGMGNVKKR